MTGQMQFLVPHSDLYLNPHLFRRSDLSDPAVSKGLR